MGLGIFCDFCGTSLLEADASTSGALIKFFIVFEVGADIHVIDRDFCIGVFFVEEEGVFDGVHAAEARTVNVGSFVSAADTLDERKAMRFGFI